MPHFKIMIAETPRIELIMSMQVSHFKWPTMHPDMDMEQGPISDITSSAKSKLIPSLHPAKPILSLEKYYKQINDVFAPIERERILEIIKQMPLISNLSKSGLDMLCSTQPEELSFSCSHQMAKPRLIFSRYPALKPIQNVYIHAINRFAKELQLVDNHKITFKLVKLHDRKGVPFQGGWHYDIKTSITLLIMLKNQFKYLDGSKGLDIAFNESFGPHDPSVSMGTEPENQNYHKIAYNDGILIDNGMGEVVHRTPPLELDPLAINRERVYIQIKLFDPTWKKFSGEPNTSGF